MAKRSLKGLIPEKGPLAAPTQRFITFYVGHRDVRLAACQAKVDPDLAVKLHDHPKVKAEIDKKIALVDAEEASLRAKANLLTVDKIDATVVELLDKKENGHIRLRASELAYRRTGMIREGEFYVQPDPNANKNAPSIYQTQVRRTVTEEVTHTATLPTSDPIFAVKEY